MFFNSSIYAFTVMLSTVLLGIAVGSWAINPFMRRRWNWLLVFAVLELLVALSAVLSIVTLSEMYPITGWMQSVPGLRRILSTDLRFMAMVSCLAIFPPMFLLGMTFPVAARIGSSPLDQRRHADRRPRGRRGGRFSAMEFE